MFTHAKYGNAESLQANSDKVFKKAGHVVDVYYNSTYTGLGPDDSSLVINSDLTSGEINLRLTLYQMPERVPKVYGQSNFKKITRATIKEQLVIFAMQPT